MSQKTDTMITVAILTLSDKGSRGEREDLSGPAIREMIKDFGTVKYYEVIPDEKALIKEKLIDYSRKVDLILTTGGTGLSPRDVTPDATLEIIDREVPRDRRGDADGRPEENAEGDALKGRCRGQGQCAGHKPAWQPEGD